ncbi:hypothetical protein F511_47359 [Dorcoceras hygrometricum]|uniref:Uncharacterized protein n=1 Tax=Dorcoceras hygrometricum TaxID=472368 RepID=A0A2Z6ZRB1_9LAMI|nr:hypothetical protein F511_47359 [Dorcoceras hygrometricum]
MLRLRKVGLGTSGQTSTTAAQLLHRITRRFPLAPPAANVIVETDANSAVTQIQQRRKFSSDANSAAGDLATQTHV